MQIIPIGAAVWPAAGQTHAGTAAGLLGLLSAMLWGGGDFSGGMGARRMSALRVVLISHTASVTGLVILARLAGGVLPGLIQFEWGLVAGVAGGVALMCFYTALSLGDMGASAALSGLIAAGIPVVFALRTEGSPGAMKMTGFAMAAASIWLIAGTSGGQERHPTQKRAAVLALVAGVGFGVFLTAIKLAGEGGVVWSLASARVGSLGVTLLAMLVLWAQRARRQENHPDRSSQLDRSSNVVGSCPLPVVCSLPLPVVGSPPLPVVGSLPLPVVRSNPLPQAQEKDGALAEVAGAIEATGWHGFTRLGLRWALCAAVLDTSGNLIYIMATRVGRLDVAAVLGSLYPASTMLLAAWMLHERPTRRQAIGMALALASVVLITL